MKKLVLVAVAAVFGLFSVNAQEEKATVGGFENGSFFATGTVGFGSEKFADEKVSQFTFSPSVGYFVSDNIAVGVALGVTSGKEEDGVSEDLKLNSFTAGAFGQYYFTPAKQFSFFGQLSAAYVASKAEQGPVELKTNGFVAGLAPGISYFVSDCFALQASFGVLSYTTSKPDVDGAESTDTFDFGLDLTDINFTLTYKFN